MDYFIEASLDKCHVTPRTTTPNLVIWKLTSRKHLALPRGSKSTTSESADPITGPITASQVRPYSSSFR
ncbi:hypothetical protein ACFX13_007701 [Malus domestica]